MWRLLFVCLVFPIVSTAQNLEDQLKGTWVSLELTDSLGNPSSGEFGTTRNFLKFQFEGKKLFISLSPFDKGALSRINYYKKSFEIIEPEHIQNTYTVIRQEGEELVLGTRNENHKKIYYRFANLSKYSKDLDKVSDVREYEKLILEMTYVQSAKGYYFSSYYLIDNSILNLLPCPLFVDKEYFSLGPYMESNLRIPLQTMKELNGKETVFEFDVTSRGIENILITEKLGNEIDFQIYDLIRGMNKMWQPVMVDGKVKVIRIRFNVSFSYKEE